MPSLKEFVEALQAGWFPALAALVGCTIVVAGDYYSLPYVSEAPGWLVTTAVVIGIFAFSVLAANLAYLPILIFHSLLLAKKRRNFIASLEEEISGLPDDEKGTLAYLISSGRKAFVATSFTRSNSKAGWRALGP